MWQYQNTDELYHHGVPGMRWGQHLFRRLKEYNLRRKKQKLDMQLNNNSNKNKNIVFYKKANNDQLRKAAERLELENRYQRAYNEQLSLNPKQVSLGKRIISNIYKNVIAPTASTVGKAYLRKLSNKITKGGDNKQSNNLKKEIRKEISKNLQKDNTQEKIANAAKDLGKNFINNIDNKKVKSKTKEILFGQNNLGSIYINEKLFKNK